MIPISKIILVGHCGPDSFMLKSTLRRIVPDATIESADDQTTLENLARPDALMLINRVLSYGYSTTNGVELIEQLAGSDNPPALMLISNYDDAQAAAIAAGAKPGFGKSQLGQQQTTERILAAMNN